MCIPSIIPMASWKPCSSAVEFLTPKHPRQPKWLFADLGRLLQLQIDCGVLEIL
jgi:hypothetical protein